MAGKEGMGLDVLLEQGCNTQIEARIIIPNVLAHPAVKDLFVKLKENGVIQSESFEHWTHALLENYKKKYTPKDDAIEAVRLNIKAGLLFRDDKVDFGDTIYHEITIPYVDGEDLGGSPHSIDSELSIRALMVNGMFVVQVGSFNNLRTFLIAVGV